jgi:GT2 family glycosyltransferase
MQEKVIVIILNYNQNHYTLKCIDSILESNYSNYEILLVDNGSNEENYKELKDKLPINSKINFQKIELNKGYVGGINYALEQGSKLEPVFYLIMNNDTILDENAIREFVSTVHKFDYKSIITGKVYHYDDPKRFQDLGYSLINKKKLKFNRIGLNEIDNGQFDTVSERDMLDDIFWLFPHKLYIEIGGYSNYFWFNSEQADFAMRAKKIGYKLIYQPKAKIWHKGSVSIGGREDNPRLVYWAVQGSLIFRFRNLSTLDFIAFFITNIINIFGSYMKRMFFKKSTTVEKKMAYAKIIALIFFIKWLFIRKENIGYNPFDK